MNPFLLFLLAYGLFFLFAVCAYFFGSMLTKEPLAQKEAIVAALLLAFLAAIPGILLLTCPGMSHHWLGTRAYPFLAACAIIGFLVKKYDCDVWPSILMTGAALLPPGLILYSLRDVLV